MIEAAVLLGAIALAVGWRWPLIGALAFDAMGFAFLVAAWGRVPPSTLFLVAGPMFVIAALLYLHHRRRRADPS